MTPIDRDTTVAELLIEKLRDAESSPGFEVEFDPEEADTAGAFAEDALSEVDALESSIDWVSLEGGDYHG